MSRSLRLHPGAQSDLAEATAYYEAGSAGLGDAFLAQAGTSAADLSVTFHSLAQRRVGSLTLASVQRHPSGALVTAASGVRGR